jgi:hypothetical protein
VLAQANTKGRSVYGDKYRVFGTMKSGSPFTTLMNSVLNALAHVFVLSQILNITIFEMEKVFRITVAGDDCVLAIAPSAAKRITLAQISEGLLQLGFKAKLEYATFETVIYLGCQPWPVRANGVETIAMAPHLGRAFAKIGWSLLRQEDDEYWWNSIVKGAQTTFSPVPIIGKMFSSTVVGRHGKVEYLPAVKTGAMCETTPESLLLFDRRYSGVRARYGDVCVAPPRYSILGTGLLADILQADGYGAYHSR